MCMQIPEKSSIHCHVLYSNDGNAKILTGRRPTSMQTVSECRPTTCACLHETVSYSF